MPDPSTIEKLAEVFVKFMKDPVLRDLMGSHL